MRETRKRGFVIKPEGLALIEKTMKEKGYNSREKLAEAADYLSIDTVNRLFRGNKTERKTIEAIAKALDLKPTDLVDPSEWYPASSTAAQEKTAADEINIDWQEVCHRMLKEQQDKQRLRRQATEMGFEVNVHVPLGLVQRKQQQRRDGNVELSQLYQLDQKVIAKTYQHDEFLTEVIGQRQARKNKHIAIVGEPGAGKTTLLGAIASSIQSNTEDLPICISLASLQGKTLEDYLLKTWLSEAMGLVNPEVVVTLEIENELIKQFRKGGVWLLLDGVDEMVADSPVQALATIQKQLTDWLGQARLVLTCRVNVWDANVNNILTGFDTYRTQEFTHEQIDQFIQEWFFCAEDAQRGEQLQTKLKEPGRERILELVKHPLRLALLCQTFYLDKSGDLPETKAALYERFTRYFYDWKPNLHSEDLINQDELKDKLHQALGKLALAGINSATRFRLRQSLVRQEMGERLFKLACDFGWLNLVERDAKTDEPVYAFFHANFQEYFAALTINDWHYLLNHVPDNPEEGIYRIFEPQWKEVFLLWLGREDLPKEHKEAFIKALGTFDEKCDDSFYYWERANCLIIMGIAEFRDFRFADEIVDYVLNFVVSTYDEEDDQEDPSIGAALAALKESDRSKVIPALLNLLDNSQDKDICVPAIRRLGEIADGNREAITALTELLHNSQDENILLEVIKSLGKTGFGNSEVITSLTKLLHNIQNKHILLETARTLEAIDPGNSEAILTQERESLRRHLAFNPIKTKVHSILMALLQTSRDNAIKDLTKLVQTTQDTIIICEAAKCLGRIGSGNLDAITALDKLVRNHPNQDIRIEAACILVKIDPDNSEAATTLIEEVRTQPHKIHNKINGLEFSFCEASNASVVRVLLELLEVNQFKDVFAIDVLGKIGYGCSEAITGLVQILRTSKNENSLDHALISLGEIAFGHPEAITTVIEVLRTSQDEPYYWQAINTLGKIAFNHPEAIKVLIEILYKNKRKDGVTRLVAESLSKISAGNLEAVTALLALQRTGVDIGENALWYCSQNTPYPVFYCAWHSQPSTTHPEAPDNIPVGDSPAAQALEPQFTDITSEVQLTDKTYPIIINAQALEGETDTSAIAQALSNRIYRFVFPDDSEIPPEVSNAYQLERLIPQIKKQLQKQNLALILDNCEPNQAQITFCRKLSDVLHCAWITEAPLEPPLKGFPPNQPNLLSAIQSWIDEIG